MSSEDVRIDTLSPDEEGDSIFFSTIRSRHAEHFFAEAPQNLNQNQKSKKGVVRYSPYEDVNPNPRPIYPSLVLNKLSFSKDLRSPSDKALLRLPVLKQEFHNVSFELSSADVMAIMYTKESEVMSLLKVLCGVKEAKGKLSGDILVNGHRMSRDRMEKTVAFISSESPTSMLTVRQYLKVHASFHPPMSERYGGVVHLINKLMSDLGLMPVSDIICSRLNRSQWQRVKVAAQLARDPSILICSDLFKDVDVHDHGFLIDYLREWAVKTSRIVIMAVSPTSLQVLRMFSKTLILASGRVVFYGPPNNMVSYFESIGCPCPPYKNICDYYVDLVTHDNLTSDASRESSVRIARLVNKWNQAAPPIRRTASGKFLLDLPTAGFIMRPITLLSLFWFEYSNNRVSRLLTLFLIFSISTCLSLFLSDLSLTLPEAFLDRNSFMDLFCFYFPLLIGLIHLKKYRHRLKELLKLTMFRKNCSTLLFVVSSILSEICSILVTSLAASIPIAVFTDFHRKSADYLASIISLSTTMILTLFVTQLIAQPLCTLSSEPLAYFFFSTSWTLLYFSTGFPLPVPSMLKLFSPLQLPTFSVFRFLYQESPSMLPSLTANLTNPVQLYSCGRTFLNTSQVTKGPCQRVPSFDLLAYYGYRREKEITMLFGYCSFSMHLFSKFILLLLLISHVASKSSSCDKSPMPVVQSMKPDFGGSDGFYDMAKELSDGLQDSNPTPSAYKNLGALVFGSNVDSGAVLKEMLMDQNNPIIMLVFGMILIASAVILLITSCVCLCFGKCSPKDMNPRTSYNGYVFAGLLLVCSLLLLSGTVLFNNAESDMIESVDDAVIHTAQISSDLIKVMSVGTKQLACEVEGSTGAIFAELKKMVDEYPDTVISKTAEATGYNAVKLFNSSDYEAKNLQTEQARAALETAITSGGCAQQVLLVKIQAIKGLLDSLTDAAKKINTDSEFSKIDSKMTTIRGDIKNETDAAQKDIDGARDRIQDTVKSLNEMLVKIQKQVDTLTKSIKSGHKDIVESSGYSAGQIVLRIFVSILALLGAAFAVFAIVTVIFSMQNPEGIAQKLAKFVLVGFFTTLVFTIIILIFATFVFIVGWVMSAFCVPMFDDPEFRLFKLRKEPLRMSGNSSKGNSSGDVNIGEVLMACQDTQTTIFKAIDGSRIFSEKSINKQLNLDGIRDNAKKKIDQQANETFAIKPSYTDDKNKLGTEINGVKQTDVSSCSAAEKAAFQAYLAKLDTSMSLSDTFYNNLQKLHDNANVATVIARRENHAYFKAVKPKIDATVEHLMKSVNVEVFKCSPLIDVYRNGEFLMCERFGKPIHALWASIGMCGVTLFILSIILLLTYKWLKSKDGQKRRKSRKSKNSKSKSKKSKASKKSKKSEMGKEEKKKEDEVEKVEENGEEQDEAVEKGKKASKEKEEPSPVLAPAQQQNEAPPPAPAPAQAPPPAQTQNQNPPEPQNAPPPAATANAFPVASTAPAPAESPAEPPPVDPSAAAADAPAPPAPPAEPLDAPPAPPAAPPGAPADPFAPPA